MKHPNNGGNKNRDHGGSHCNVPCAKTQKLMTNPSGSGFFGARTIVRNRTVAIVGIKEATRITGSNENLSVVWPMKYVDSSVARPAPVPLNPLTDATARESNTSA